MIEKNDLLRMLGEFFMSSLYEDAGDVANWCDQNENSVDDIVKAIEVLEVGK